LATILFDLFCISIIKILLIERPKFLISTGGELTIPFFYLSKLFFGTKLIYLEIYARVTTPSVAGKLVYPITDLFLVQWQGLCKKYGKKARYVGALV
jgi:UDP-N-acetylglucosamine:LPS N-acetylglucosamine transferase